VTSPDYAINLEHLRFAYRRGPEVLDIREFSVYTGNKVFLYGPSGSGKTTLLGIIAGVLQPNSSRHWTVLHRELGKLSQAERDAFRGEEVGYLFQMFNLLPWLSVLENVTLPVELHRARRDRLGGASPREAATALLERLDLASFVHTPVAELSVGQQQRVAAARALIGRPGLIIADEPTSALDADRRNAFLDLLFAECESAGSTLLFVSHDLSLGPRFDHQMSLPAINGAAQVA
jgi:putative ABC transport system ATP-binding protein